MEIMVKPHIKQCGMEMCSYNMDKKCHAVAVTIGKNKPCCDTFLKESEKGGFDEITGGVGACKVKNCIHNKSFECSADEISVEQQSRHPYCMTFEKK